MSPGSSRRSNAASATSAASGVEVTSNVLASTRICVGGSFPGFTHAQLQRLILRSGGVVSPRINSQTTHLLSTQDEFDKNTDTITRAKARQLPIVSLDWILDSNKEGKALSTNKYAFASSRTSSPKAVTALKEEKKSGVTESTRGVQKALAEDSIANEDNDDQDADGDEDADKKVRSAKRQASATDDDEAEMVTVIRKGAAPVDPYSSLKDTHRVHTSTSDEIYTATLNQTDIKKNANKAYFIQLLVPDSGKDSSFLFARWGRVGESGQQQTKGPFSKAQGEIEFEKQFKSKTGFHFAARRTAVPKPGKYYWLDIARGGEDDDENGVGDDDNDQQGGQTDDGGVYDQDQKAVSSASPSRAPTTSPKKRRLSPQEVPSKLSRPVQELAKLIFNQALFDATLAEMNYDAKKQPLGSLSKHTIEKGMEKLTLLSDAIKQGTMDNIDALSDAYYSLIPHIFSRKTRPVPIDNMDIVRNELDILSTLSEMKVGFKLMHNLDDSSTNRLDARIEGLKLSTLEPLERSTNEYQKVCELVETTHGKTHSWFNITVGDIFSIEREGESEHFGKQHGDEDEDRRLLFHGSRLANYGGIMSQGLRIAPPAAPANGYAFGRGIYLADVASKSAQYLYHHISNNEGLMLLCEAQLGKIVEMKTPNYDAAEVVMAQGGLSTKGLGRTIPAGWADAGDHIAPHLKGVKVPIGGLRDEDGADTYLQYNEYIVYDESQVRFRYLMRLTIS